jgi:hypothetical protein
MLVYQRLIRINPAWLFSMLNSPWKFHGSEARLELHATAPVLRRHDPATIGFVGVEDLLIPSLASRDFGASQVGIANFFSL